MTSNLLLALVLLAADGAPENPALSGLEAAIRVPELTKQADTSFLVRLWDRALTQYAELTAANPTNGYAWWRLGTCQLETGKYDDAIASFTKSQELGGFQWNPPRMIYRGESAWGIAAAHARAGRKEEAIRWTRTAIDQGLRDIHRFHGGHFASLLDDPEYRKLVWATDVKGLSREEGFRHDLQFFLHEAKRIHYAPFRLTSEAELDALAERLSADIPQLSDDQIFVRMMAIVARLGDGHSQIGRGGKRARLPVHFFRFPEGLYISAALPAQADLVGAKVIKIGDRPADEAWKLMAEITSRDNPMTVLSFVPMLLGSPAILRGLGIASGDGPVPLEIEDTAGQTRRVELAALEIERNEKSWVSAVAGCDKPLPLSLRSRSKTYSFELLSDQRLLYCQLNGIGIDKEKTLTDFCKNLFAAAERPEVEALVIDIRYNGGGDTFTNPPLITGILRSDKLNRPGNLFVIIGRHTFSAAQNTTSELERRTQAILVGEPTGSSPNFIGESLHIPLPYSGWGFSASDLWWQHSMAMDYRTWTPPHLYAPPTAAAYRAHVDPSMEAIAAYRARAAKAKK